MSQNEGQEIPRGKKTVFWLIMILLVLLSIEMPFRILDYREELAFRKAQAELVPMSLEEFEKFGAYLRAGLHPCASWRLECGECL